MHCRFAVLRQEEESIEGGRTAADEEEEEDDDVSGRREFGFETAPISST